MRTINVLTIISLLATILLWPARPDLSAAEAGTATNYRFDHLRLENEDNLSVPDAQVSKLWQYLNDNFVASRDFLASLDLNLTTSQSDEEFTDQYFDTAKLELLALKDGVRHRYRFNDTNPEDKKSGRELVQAKISNIDDNAHNRGELKFSVASAPAQPKSQADTHSLLRLLSPDDRLALEKALREIKIMPASLRPILTNVQKRRRIYINLGDLPFMTLSLDNVRSRRWWFKTEYNQLEIELNEITYTAANGPEREFMRQTSEQIVGRIIAAFPELKQDLTPKYNKSWNNLDAKIPWFRFLVRIGIM